ncbi:MAG: RtcB family protein [Phycisphaerales bacterium]|nr:RtcB family protein [Phycisphaerales bacterium]
MSSQPPRDPAPFRTWGRVGEHFDEASLQQLRDACSLPIAAAGALMPDAHVGYGLPIGGVLATRGAVIPYAVGVDIACRVKISVLDLPASTLDDERGRERLRGAIERETRFGVGAEFKTPRQHDVMDRDWTVSPVTAELKDKAHRQLGTSGSGNHFVEFGVLALERPELGLEAGRYLALLSHSGSRGAGAAVCERYSKLAAAAHPELDGPLKRLAWLDIASQEGREYWDAMNLMGEYASANHACIHRHVAEHLGAGIIAGVENHHNFAWIETHDVGDGPEEVVVHRKGATPAGEGVLGVIPGSMASPTFIVRGRAGPESLRSASHGAGRVMSRTQAKKTLRWNDVNRTLRESGVELLAAGIDEAPGVYKDIHEVMHAQRDLVDPIARFEPRLVKMAPSGERPED